MVMKKVVYILVGMSDGDPVVLGVSPDLPISALQLWCREMAASLLDLDVDELEGPLMDEPQPYLGWSGNVHFICKNKDRCIPKTELHYTIHRDVLS